jgi:hypothetical protein
MFCPWNCSYFAALWHMFTFSIRISWQTPQLIPVVSVSSWIVQWWSLWVGNFFNIFFVLLVLGQLECLLSSTDTWPALAIQKLLSGMQNGLQKSPEAFQRFQQWIYLASHKTWCRHVTWFGHPSQAERNIKLKKHLWKNSVFTAWCQMACGSVTSASPLLSPRH